MRILNEGIAREVNAEDGFTGRLSFAHQWLSPNGQRVVQVVPSILGRSF